MKKNALSLGEAHIKILLNPKVYSIEKHCFQALLSIVSHRPSDTRITCYSRAAPRREPASLV